MSENVRTYIRFGKRYLSEEEMTDRSKRLANSLHSLDRKREEFDEVKKQYASEIKQLETEIKALGGQVKDGFELTSITCVLEKDFVKKLRRYRSIESAEVIAVEPLTQEDYQLNMNEQVAT